MKIKQFMAFMFVLAISMVLLAPSLSSYDNGPDWLITEISADQSGGGMGVADYSSTADPFEFIEIYNNSGNTLNLYDYCLTYNGNVRSHTSFEKTIYEITRLKAGDYRENISVTYPLGSKMTMVNPANGSVDAGETVVLWSVYADTYSLNLSLAEFRQFWSIPNDVKVFMFDGNSGAADKNFNIKNSGVGTYGIAKYSSVLAPANATGSYTPVDGYNGFDGMISYATFDYTDTGLNTASLANYTMNYKYSPSDGKRMAPLAYSPYSDATPGFITEVQRSSLPSVVASGTWNGATPETADNLLLFVVVIVCSALCFVVLGKRFFARVR